MSDRMNPELSIVVPCYNEAQRLDRLAESLRKFDGLSPWTYEVLLVDDGSTDETSEIIRRHILPSLPNAWQVQLIAPGKNGGKGQALSLGVAAAQGSFILTMDADVSTPPEQLLDWAKLHYPNGWSAQTVLIGSRAHPESKIDALQTRKFTGSIYNAVIRVLTPLGEPDTQCGFKLYPGELARRLFRGLQIKGWAHDIEILYKAHLLGYGIHGLPLTWSHVDNEKISVLRDGFIMFWQTLYISTRIRWEWLMGKRF
jgi:dolichyl-phosphate beta-glucosyltransferase